MEFKVYAVVHPCQLAEEGRDCQIFEAKGFLEIRRAAGVCLKVVRPAFMLEDLQPAEYHAQAPEDG